MKLNTIATTRILLLCSFIYMFPACDFYKQSETYISCIQMIRNSYNSKTIVLEDGKYQTEFHGKWINYMDEKHEWKEIDPSFTKTSKGFEMTEAPFQVIAPFYADEAAVFHNNNRYDMYSRRK